MITINLLPLGVVKEKYKGRLFVVAYGIGLAIALIGLVSIKTNVLDVEIERLTGEKRNLDSRLIAVKKQVEAADTKTKQAYRQWQQLVSIIELEERRRDQTRLLVEIEKLVPKDSAWLISLDHAKGLVVLEGISSDKEVISQFLDQLESAVYIDKPSVSLMEITQNMVINDIKLTKFKIRAATKFPEPDILIGGLPDQGLPSQADFIKAVTDASPTLVQGQASAKDGRRGI